MGYLKRWWAVPFLLVALLAAGLTGCSGSGGGGHLGVSAFASTVEQPGTVVIDVRTPSEYGAGHLPGAINIDVEGGGFDQQIASLDKNASYALYCHSGRRSGIALDTMTSAGFTHVVDLSGGVTAWTSEGRQLVTGS